jgi:hypothetical protein
MTLQTSCLLASTRFERQTDSRLSTWLRRIAVARLLYPRAWAERAVARRYAGCAWNDTLEREMASEIMARGYGR